MPRQFLTIERLLEVMNTKLVRYDTCVECRFKTIVPLEEPDENGCNWSHANLNCRGFPSTSGQEDGICKPTTVCQPYATQVINDAKGKYNVR